MSLLFSSGKKSGSSQIFSPPSPPEYDLTSAMVDPIFDYQFRVILIGDSTVGKSSLLKYFTEGTFAEVSDPTVGVDFFARLVKVNDATIKLQLWDTAGQERFRSITKSYYRNSVGVVLAYDITNHDSFSHIPVWMQEAKKHIEPYKAVFVLVGCKLDIAESDPSAREVSRKEATDFATAHQIVAFETSAKSGENVMNAFTALSFTIHDKIKKGEYKVDDGWDGIKKGYFARSGVNANNNLSGTSGLRRAGTGLAEAEPANRTWCC